MTDDHSAVDRRTVLKTMGVLTASAGLGAAEGAAVTTEPLAYGEGGYGEGSYPGETSDTSAPSAPSNLQSSGRTDTTVDLDWDASGDDVGVDHYNVYVNAVQWGEVGGVSATVDGLATDTTYEFYVTAEDAVGNESRASSPVTATTDVGSSVTPSIDSFDATSGSPNNPHAEVEVRWSISGSPDSVTLELYQGTDTSGDPVRRWSVGASGTQTYTEKFASPTQYTARVIARRGTEEVKTTDGIQA